MKGKYINAIIVNTVSKEIYEIVANVLKNY